MKILFLQSAILGLKTFNSLTLPPNEDIFSRVLFPAMAHRIQTKTLIESSAIEIVGESSCAKKASGSSRVEKFVIAELREKSFEKCFGLRCWIDSRGEDYLVLCKFCELHSLRGKNLDCGWVRRLN